MVRALEPGAGLETPDEGAIKGNRSDHGPLDPPSPQDGHLPRGCGRVAPADVEATGRLDGEMSVSSEHALQRGPVVSEERALEGWTARESLCSFVG